MGDDPPPPSYGFGASPEIFFHLICLFDAFSMLSLMRLGPVGHEFCWKIYSLTCEKINAGQNIFHIFLG